MSAPLSEQTLAAIRADLAAVPAPPWRWIGVRGAGGPQLVTDHSGRQYLLRAAKPVDGRGDEVLDPATDYPVYGDLEFRDQRNGEQYPTMRAGDRLAVGRTSYDEDSIIDVDNPVARWVERSAAHAAALLAEVDRLAEQRDRRRGRLVKLQNDALNMRGALSPDGEPRKVPFPLGETLTPAVEWLIARVAELEQQAAEVRAAGAEIVRSLLPTQPDNETDEGIAWALNLAADAVEREHR
ncbi:hypothetical protein NMG29_06455 [Streptomyces cocklensis]|uniref:Uncharacterized protein n=1 Tax=Actinacidiphila cocklensis TaxID=887465 RepID=A0A9W4DN97_9ACTN|nr:hypothetical protein [Actinacidiphila cocklensis]MDD1057872.1 hypothetical protein [Actinacidiphila cocklensis]CAG6392733.1 hypothetical protein SCOCK_180110 [Actinacidiphila cocklensis]